MKIISTIEQERAYSEEAVFVPTMGSLHSGHLSLVEKAKEFSCPIWMSIFVNILQFNNSEDYTNYPKDLNKDISKAEAAGVDVLFTPDTNYILREESLEHVSSGHKGVILEGESRPGHFDGVLTIVNRLLDLIKPKYMVLGKKDAQQLFLIKKKLKEKYPRTEFISSPIVREDSGLALSSRNKLLSNLAIETSAELFKCLKIFYSSFSSGDSVEDSRAKAKYYIDQYPKIELDYLEIVDAVSFNEPRKDTFGYFILIAAVVDGVRLIDNIYLEKKNNKFYVDLGTNLTGEGNK